MKSNGTAKVAVFGLLTALMFAGLVYLAVFGRALGQDENHIGVAMALPEAVFGQKAVMVDDKTYLAKNPGLFIKEMESRGYEFAEQLGSGYIFRKDGGNFISVGRMYSSRFMLFSVPEKN